MSNQIYRNKSLNITNDPLLPIDLYIMTILQFFKRLGNLLERGLEPLYGFFNKLSYVTPLHILPLLQYFNHRRFNQNRVVSFIFYSFNGAHRFCALGEGTGESVWDGVVVVDVVGLWPGVQGEDVVGDEGGQDGWEVGLGGEVLDWLVHVADV